MLKKIMTASLTSIALIACTATATNTQSYVPPQANEVIMPLAVENPDNKLEITLNKIMSDPDWMGRSPERGFWASDSDSVLYYQKQEGKVTRDLFQRSLTGTGNGEVVADANKHEFERRNVVFNADRSIQAFTFKGNLFVQKGNDAVQQLTQSSERQAQPMFMVDGRLSYRQGDTFYALDLSTGLSIEVASIKMSDAPKGIEDPKGYVAEEQHKLIEYVALKHQQKKDRKAQKDALNKANSTITAKPFYLGKGLSLVDAQLSPKGDRIIAVTEKTVPSRKDSDIMPNYIGQDGLIKSEKVRARVADAKPASHTITILNIDTGKQQSLKYDSLPGFDEDVLAEVKFENAKKRGEDYKSERKARDIQLIWNRQPVSWNAKGDQVALMLEAWDNKDRWIATVDFAKTKLVSQHRLHDEAWVNYTFNNFGWLNNSDTLYYLSEQSGYSHLYIKPLNGKEKALTSGQYLVDSPTLTADDGFVYFKANRKHPGIYEIYRVALSTGNIEALTDLNGNTDYALSPDESKLLLTHSKIVMPPELYLQDAKPNAEVTRLTQTVSKEFLAMPWTAPDIVPVKSSHTKQPIYAKVYKPADMMTGEKRKAVMFAHGAGYLQNSHLGWSGYFREFMFHSMLAQQGYVVMDMDYRASKGYGRDWRTAIYRDMGRPEVEDLTDGVNWLANNANVDSKRVGIYGGSYGGFLTFMSLFNSPELFQAGAALRPVSDWAHYNHGYTSNILNTPDVDPIAYERSSPIYHTEGLNKPLLINAPMVDNNVFFVDVVRLVQILIEQEKEDFETAIYPVEPHGFVQPSSWLDEYRRIYKLFEENL